ncbi:MAG: hypothetical protein LUE64_04265, partial [Candidatus Gastranaerophilales bacterium]|nr:hypothetical protein [Candidatus Gastranaerophilales bacterium]
MLFGLYPSKYIGGNPYALSRGRYYGGMYGAGIHPSMISSNGVNYFGKTGIKPAASLNYAQNNVPIQNANAVTAPVNDSYIPQTQDAQVESLQASLKSVKDKQGLIGKCWDGVKSATGIGLSSKKCQSYINDFQNGKITYDEALEKIDNYNFKQKNSVDLMVSMAAGALSVAAVKNVKGLTGILAAAGIGAGTKAGVKTIERCTNDVKHDTFDAKEIAKDGLSGALSGAVSAATIGIGQNTIAGAKSANEALKHGAVAGAKGGAVAGAVMGAGNYSIDCVLDENEDFDAEKFVKTAANGAIAGAATGAVIGGISARANFNKGAKPKTEADSSKNSGGDTSAQPKNDTSTQPKGETTSTGAQQPKGETPVQPQAETPTQPKGETTSTGGAEQPKGTVQQPKSETPVQPESETPVQPKSDSTSTGAQQPKGETPVQPQAETP